MSRICSKFVLTIQHAYIAVNKCMQAAGGAGIVLYNALVCVPAFIIVIVFKCVFYSTCQLCLQAADHLALSQ